VSLLELLEQPICSICDWSADGAAGRRGVALADKAEPTTEAIAKAAMISFRIFFSFLSLIKKEKLWFGGFGPNRR
jgi:hypothetical protein